jgi:hypothetical protein
LQDLHIKQIEAGFVAALLDYIKIVSLIFLISCAMDKPDAEIICPARRSDDDARRFTGFEYVPRSEAAQWEFHRLVFQRSERKRVDHRLRSQIAAQSTKVGSQLN